MNFQKKYQTYFPPLPPPPSPRFRKTQIKQISKNFNLHFPENHKKSRLVVSQHPGRVEYRSCSLRNPFEDAKPPGYQWVYIITASECQWLTTAFTRISGFPSTTALLHPLQWLPTEVRVQKTYKPLLKYTLLVNTADWNSCNV